MKKFLGIILILIFNFGTVDSVFEKKENIDLNLYEVIDEEEKTGLKLLNKGGKLYLYYHEDIKKPKVLEIKGISGKGLKFVDSFKILKDNTNLFKFDGGFFTSVKKYELNEDGSYTLNMKGEIINKKLEKEIFTIIFQTDFGEPKYKVLKHIEGIDYETFDVIQSDYFKDKNSVYFNKFMKGILKVEKADTETFVVEKQFGNPKVYDKNYIFSFGKITGKQIIKNINTLRLKSKVLFFKDSIFFKKSLEKTKKGELYKGAVDKRVSSLDNKQIVVFHNLLGKIDLGGIKYKKYKEVLEYMKAKIGIEIWKRDDIEKEIID